MEQIRRIAQMLWEVFLALVELFEPIFRALFEALFNVDIPAGGARPFTVIFLLLFGFWAVSKAYFAVTKSTANQPMKITLTTDKTPAQVVREDREKHLGAWLIILIVLAAIFLLTR